MFIKKIFGILTTFCLIGIVLFCLSGCAEKIVNENNENNENNDDEVTVLISAKMSGIEMSELVQVFLLVVEADDFLVPRLDTLARQGSFLVAEVSIPAGLNRRFTVRAFDIDSTLIYQGVDSADVIVNSTVTVNIDMFPVVPLLKIIPKKEFVRTDSVDMGESFVVDLYAYNIPDVRYISFDLSYLTNNYLLNFLYISHGADLPKDSRISYEGSIASVTVWFDRPNPADPLVDSLGNAHLLTFYFDTHFDTLDDYDTASFEITPLSFERGELVSDPFPLDSLYLESAIVELYKVSGS